MENLQEISALQDWLEEGELQGANSTALFVKQF